MKADFKREMIGEMPTEMFLHFFKSFSDAAACNLNIKAEGIMNTTESIFKAFAKAVKRPVKPVITHQHKRNHMIAIIKYNAGNVVSVKNALEDWGKKVS